MKKLCFIMLFGVMSLFESSCRSSAYEERFEGVLDQYFANQISSGKEIAMSKLKLFKECDLAQLDIGKEFIKAEEYRIEILGHAENCAKFETWDYARKLKPLYQKALKESIDLKQQLSAYGALPNGLDT